MIFSNRKISVRQMQASVVLIIFSSSLIGLPSAAVYNIYSVIIGALIAAAECAAICFASERLCRLGKTGTVIKAAAGLSLVLFAGINIKFVCSASSMYLLPRTPSWITAAVFAAAAFYLASRGLQPAGRTSEIIFVIAAVNAVLAAVICLYDTKGGLLSAAFEQAGENVLLNGLKCSFMFGGAQSLLILLPETDGEDKGKRAIYAVIIALAAVVVFTYTAVSKFGLRDTADRVFPALNIMDTVNLEAFFGDRQDVLMLRMWFFTAFAAVALEVLVFGMAVRTSGNFIPGAAVGAAAALAVSFLFEDVNMAVSALYIAGGASLILFGALTPLISLAAGKEGEGNGNEKIRKNKNTTD